MLQSRYRRDYDGEFIITETVIANNTTQQRREWIPNQVENSHISGRAAVVGSRDDFKWFNHKKIENHRGGLLGRLSMQTYGAGPVWQDMRFDFFGATQADLLSELAATDYDKSTTVFTTASNCMRYPGRFYPIPYLPALAEIAIPVYLAAFDGHREIFLLGYNANTAGGVVDWQEHVNAIFQTYQDTQFRLVTRLPLPPLWLHNRNVRPMRYREFVTYCDI